MVAVEEGVTEQLTQVVAPAAATLPQAPPISGLEHYRAAPSLWSGSDATAGPTHRGAGSYG